MTATENKKPIDWRLETVPLDEDNSRLDRFVRRLVPGLAQGSIERMLRNGLIRVDGNKVKANSRLLAGQIVRLPPNLKQAPAKNLLQSPKLVANSSLRKQFDKMFLAEGLGWMAINKPSGLAVQGGTSITTHLDGMLQALASKSNDRLRLVHRIDKDTSGIVLLAKTLASARALTEAFRRQRIEKTYLAIVVGLPPESGKIQARLMKLTGRFGEKIVVNNEGQDATTLFQRIDHAGRKLSLMALRPLTGRTHQLRVHMQYLKTPICGDSKYGGAEAQPEGLVERCLHLHAWQIRLTDGSVITAPLSAHFAATMQQLGLAEPRQDWQFQSR